MDAPKVSNIFMYILRVVMQRSLIFASIGGASILVVSVFWLFSVFDISSKDYAIDIDPKKDNQNLCSTARVTLTNTGKLPVTNIAVNYGGNGITNAIEKLALLSPGEKVLLSPP